MVLKSSKFDRIIDQKMTENSKQNKTRLLGLLVEVEVEVALIFQCSLSCHVRTGFSFLLVMFQLGTLACSLISSLAFFES